MNIKKTLIRGSIGVAVGLPLALQLGIPTAASARAFPPSIISASPNSGPTSGGTTVTITGNSLAYASGVLFGNVPATYTIVSSTEIIATSPAESAGTVALHLEEGTAVMPGSVDFTYS
jgi:hypothetical protein